MGTSRGMFDHMGSLNWCKHSFIVMPVVLSAVPRDKYVVGRLELREITILVWRMCTQCPVEYLIIWEA
jgi:hypothetical protein